MKRRLSYNAEESGSDRRRARTNSEDSSSGLIPKRPRRSTTEEDIPVLHVPTPDDASKQVSSSLVVDLRKLEDARHVDTSSFSPLLRDSYQDFSAEPLWSEDPSTATPDHSATLSASQSQLKHTRIAPSHVNANHRIFIFDLDETLIVFNSLLSGRFDLLMANTKHSPSKFPPVAPAGTSSSKAPQSSPPHLQQQGAKKARDISSVMNVGRRMEALILRVARKYFFFQDFFDIGEITHVRDASLYDDQAGLSDYVFEKDNVRDATGLEQKKKIAYRLRRIKEAYSTPVDQLLTKQEHDDLVTLLGEIDKMCEGWVGETVDLLKHQAKDPHTIAVLVSAGSLTPTLAKCLLFGISQYFPIDLVYSSRMIGKAACFEEIQTCFGARPKYLAIGDSVEEMQAARQLDIPFFAITTRSDITLLHSLLAKPDEHAGASAEEAKSVTEQPPS